MSLNQAIRFRFLAAQLTQSETYQFVTKLLNGNSNIIIKALFNQILNTFVNQQPEADNINDTISNIILSRKKKPKPIPIQNIKLDQLPKLLIGVTSSFLDQNDNLNFSKTNRFIFLGCNSPNLLQELDLTAIQNYSYVNLTLYPSVKDLKLHLHKFNELIPFTVMNELETIELNANFDGDIDIDTFLAFNGINVDNITTLKCSKFKIPFPNYKLMQILTKFPNVQYLNLKSVHLTLHANVVKDLYPNLKGLKLDSGLQANHKLINTFGNNLHFLSFTTGQSNFDFNLQNTNFGKLQELRLTSPTIKTMNDILLTAKNLKQICIHSKSFMNLKPKETKQTMTKLITSCKSLQYVEFFPNYKLLEPVLDGIENGLFETKKWKRDQFRIVIGVVCGDAFNPNNSVSNIGKVVHWLDYLEINDFQLAFIFRHLSEKIDKNIVLKEFKSKCLSKNVMMESKSSRLDTIVVFTNANTNCKNNRLYVPWKM